MSDEHKQGCCGGAATGANQATEKAKAATGCECGNPPDQPAVSLHLEHAPRDKVGSGCCGGAKAGDAQVERVSQK